MGPNVSKLGNQKKTCSILIFPFVSSSTHLSLVFDSPKRPSLVSAQPWLLAPILLLSLHRSPLLSKPENSSLLSPILAPADPPVLFISKPKGALGFQTHLSVSRFFAPLITTKVSFPFSIQPFDSQSWKLLVLIWVLGNFFSFRSCFYIFHLWKFWFGSVRIVGLLRKCREVAETDLFIYSLFFWIFEFMLMRK